MWTPFILLSLIAKTALGTSFYERPFPDAVKNAPIMARGKIGTSTVDMAPVSDGNQLMFTFYTFKVTEVLKGELKLGSIKIREIGGEKNGVGMSVSGSAEFSSGEDVVIFLDQPVNEAYPLRGMMMGRFAIEKGADGKEYLKGAGIGTTNPQTQWSLEAVRELIQKQKDEPDAHPAESLNDSKNTVMADEKNSMLAKNTGRTETSLPPANAEPSAAGVDSEILTNESGRTFLRERRVPSIWVVLAGIGTGVYFYLRIKKRRK